MSFVNKAVTHRLLALAEPRLSKINGAVEQFRLDADGQLDAEFGIDLLHSSDPAHSHDARLIGLIDKWLDGFKPADDAIAAAGGAAESPEARRHRLRKLRDEEIRFGGSRGAVARVARNEKAAGRSGDEANVRKWIKLADGEHKQSERAALIAEQASQALR